MLNYLRVTAVNKRANLAVSLNMAVFKIFCFIGFVLLSCGHARKHAEAKHRLYHPRHLIHQHKHIVQPHFNGKENKKSEKVDPHQKYHHAEPTMIVGPNDNNGSNRIVPAPGKHNNIGTSRIPGKVQ